MTDPLAPLLDHLADRYAIERELGGGGMSRVFLATERALGRRVVIKVLAPELGQRVNVDRFLQEVTTAAALQHPQIVPVHHAGDEDGLRYYVMPFVSGESLRARLQREGRLAPRDALHLVAPLARALAYAHRQGIVHRDVKPENVLLSEGEPMLADFGIAKVVREGGDHSGLTSAGMALGTVTYMSPEQVAAESAIDGRADVYSLAAMAYELLTGTPPFSGTTAQVMSAHMVKPPTPLAPQLPPDAAPLAAVIMRGLEKDPAQRPDADTFAALLEQARTGAAIPAIAAIAAIAAIPAGTPTPTAPPTTPQAAPPPSGTAPTGATTGARARTATALVAVAAVGALASVAWQRRTATDATTAAAPAAPPAVAVLPFETIGPADDAYLSAGLTEELTTGLAQLPGLRVLSRTTVRVYTDSQFTPTDFGTRVGVRALVEGSVQRAGEQLRITARLVDTRDGSALWSNRYERPAADVFRTQEEITGAVRAALASRLRLGGAAPRREHVADAAAYDLYLRGRFALRERGESSLRSAVALFSEAALRDPAFARAHAGIAEAAVLLPIYGTTALASVADTVRASAARALAADSLLGAPHVALGLLAKGLRQWTDAEREFQRALQRDPTNAFAHQSLGELLTTLGRFDAARDTLERATALEPTDGAVATQYAYALLQTGDLDSATTVSRRAVALAPGNPFVMLVQGVVAEARGDLPAALSAHRQAASAAPLPFFRGVLARTLHLAGDTAAAAAQRRDLEALANAPGAPFARVVAGLPLRTPDAQFTDLAAAQAQGDQFLLLLPLRVSWYDRLRGDRRFAELAAALSLPVSATQANPSGPPSPPGAAPPPRR